MVKTGIVVLACEKNHDSLNSASRKGSGGVGERALGAWRNPPARLRMVFTIDSLTW